MQFPEADFKTRSSEGADFIFDPIRKAWIKLNPEEWVRQNLIAYLNRVVHIPFSLIAVEKRLKVGELYRRFDIVAFKDAKPWLLVECKAMDVPLTSATISQMLAYVSALQCPYFIMSNGNVTHGWQVKQNQFFELAQFPVYK